MKKAIFFTLSAFALFGGLYRLVAQVAPEGRYIHFNGTDQHMSVPNHPHFNIAAGESYSITCRIRPEDFAGHYTILSKGNYLVRDGRFQLSSSNSESTPNLGLHLYNSEGTKLSAPNLYNLSAGQWVHVAWVYNASDRTSKVYIDGVPVSSVANLSIGKVAVSNSEELTAGCLWTDVADPYPLQFWPGDMDELRIWKRALSADEAGADRTAPKPDGSGLVAAWDFESLQGNTVRDISGQGHTGMLHGYGIKVYTTQLPVGAGQLQERLTSVRLIPDAQRETVVSMTVDLTGTTRLSDITTLRLYCNGSEEKFNPARASLFGTATVMFPKVTITGNKPLAQGDNYFWLVADISSKAKEGNIIKAGILNYMADGLSTVSVPVSEGSRTVVLTTSLLFSPGDDGSKNYRIPAIVTAPDGSLVAATDRRWNSPHDLPSHIDVLVRRSTDNGRTWSRPVCIADETLTTGFGDPALVCNHRTGDIICLFAGNKGFFYSTAADPIRIYQSISSDNGISWSPARDITPQVYGAECSNPVTKLWQGAFVTSGNAVQLRSGRIMAVIPVRPGSLRDVSDFVIYTDDNARTWKASTYPAATSGNEGKMVELENSKLLMSIRNGGCRKFSISKDLGMTWGVPFLQTSITDPACNGDMVRYTSVIEGYDRNRILHSIPFASSRKNVSVLVSYDEGTTWPIKRTIFPGVSAYSSLCILNDGTIGLYYEVGEYDIFEMYFARFTLDWLSGGSDTWKEKVRKPATGSEEITLETASLHVYPNPATDFVTVTGDFKPGMLIGVYTMAGSLVTTLPVENPDAPVRLPVNGFSPGTYILKAGSSSVKFSVISR